jgi:hypothetical protein
MIYFNTKVNRTAATNLLRFCLAAAPELCRMRRMML